MSGLAQFLVGHVLNDRYRLETVLGQGGFGVVFRAADLRRGEKDVAVKVLDPPRGMGAAEVQRLRHRFQREAAVAARLPVHPNLVRVLDYGADARVDFLVMELLRGENLRERLERPEPLPLRTALHILRDAARGVGVGHENGLVHRDLKPANIFLEGDGAEPVVRVLDFGIAKVLDEVDDEETRTHLTMPGEWFGSECYSAPEHLRREEVGRASDVFSLGVVAFEALTRSRLYTREDQNRRRQGLPVPVPSVVARNPLVPSEVEWVVRRALLDDPAQRFADGAEMAAELHRAIGRLRRAADLPAAAPVVTAGGSRATDGVDATVLAGADGGTVLAGAAGAPVMTAGGRRGVDAPLSDLDRELERIRWRKVRAVALRAGVVLVLGGSGVAGGVLLAARSQTMAPAQAPPPALSAAEENDAGLRRFRAGEYRDALEHFGRARAKAPGQAEYMNNYAYALLRAGKQAESVQALQDVVAQFPTREVAYSNLAEAQLAQADTAGAVTTLQALLAIDPSPPRRREAEAFLRRLGAEQMDTPDWPGVPEATTTETEDAESMESQGDDWRMMTDSVVTFIEEIAREVERADAGRP